MSKKLQFLIYNTPQEDIKVNVVIRDETIWLTQRALIMIEALRSPGIFTAWCRMRMAEARFVEMPIGIFTEGEFDAEATVRKFRTVQTEGNRKVSRNVETDKKY